MAGMTLKQSERYRYHLLCKAYNTVAPDSADFIKLSLALHAAKGSDNIPKYMCTAAYVQNCGRIQ